MMRLITITIGPVLAGGPAGLPAVGEIIVVALDDDPDQAAEVVAVDLSGDWPKLTLALADQR